MPWGAVLGEIEVTKEDAAKMGLDTIQLTKASADWRRQLQITASPPKVGCKLTIRGLPVPAHAAGAGYISPRLKARMNEQVLRAADLSGVYGQRLAGRVTVEDFEKYIASLDKQKLTPASSMRVAVAGCDTSQLDAPTGNGGNAGKHGSIVGPSQSAAAKAGPTLYGMQTGFGDGFGGEQRAGWSFGRQQDRASFGD